MPIRNTQIVYRDLHDAFNEVVKFDFSPLKVRRAFVRFVTLTQQLTEAMRKEYKELTGEVWEALDFTGWDSTTELFKKLRTTDYHELPTRITVRETKYFPIIFNGEKPVTALTLKGEWDLADDPFIEVIPDGMTLVLCDPHTQEPTETTLKADRREFEYILVPRTNKIKKAIEDAGTDNLQLLSRRVMTKLENYYNFYEECFSLHSKKL